MYVPCRIKFVRCTHSLCSGHATLDGHQLLLSNLVNGLDIYAIPTLLRTRSFPHTIHCNVVLKVAFVRFMNWVVSGGDDGFGRLYDSRTGQFLQSLEHGGGKHE